MAVSERDAVQRLCAFVARKLLKNNSPPGRGIAGCGVRGTGSAVICCRRLVTATRQCADLLTRQCNWMGQVLPDIISFVHAGNAYAVTPRRTMISPAFICQFSSDGGVRRRNGQAVERSIGHRLGIIAGLWAVPVRLNARTPAGGLATLDCRPKVSSGYAAQ